jgi:hypothetical protein
MIEHPIIYLMQKYDSERSKSLSMSYWPFGFPVMALTISFRPSRVQVQFCSSATISMDKHQSGKHDTIFDALKWILSLSMYNTCPYHCILNFTSFLQILMHIT